MNLRWERQGSAGWDAYQGSLRVGFIVERDDSAFYYRIAAVDIRSITEGFGEAASLEAAQQAVERGWAEWLDRAGLMRRTDVDGVRYGLNAAADYLEGTADGAAAIATVHEQAGDTAAAAEHRAEERWARTYSEQIRELRADVVKATPRS